MEIGFVQWATRAVRSGKDLGCVGRPPRADPCRHGALRLEVLVQSVYEGAYCANSQVLSPVIKKNLAKDRNHGELLAELVSQGYDEGLVARCIAFFSAYGPNGMPVFEVPLDNVQRDRFMRSFETGWGKRELYGGIGLVALSLAFLALQGLLIDMIGGGGGVLVVLFYGPMVAGWGMIVDGIRRIRLARIMYAERKPKEVPTFDPDRRGYASWQLPPAT